VLSADAIRAAVGRVLTSPDFDVPDRARRFLTYVVEEAIAGRGDRIKAYSIATEVFGRDSDFDAQVDPVVRIEAGRLRRALEHYYLTAGRDDEIVTTIPKGAISHHSKAGAGLSAHLRNCGRAGAYPGPRKCDRNRCELA
jgi:hypothetical protein